MKSFSNIRRKAFTLIELLVVIAIIGILAAAIFPVVTAQLERARAFGMGARGRNISQGIIAANIELEALNREPIWPNADHTGYAATAPAYFDWLIGGGYLEGMSEDQFGYAGQTYVWKVVANLTGSEPDSVPLLISHNANVTSVDRSDLPADTRIDLNVDVRPFGDRLAVFVTKGASMHVVRQRYFDGRALQPNTNDFSYLDVWGTAAE